MISLTTTELYNLLRAKIGEEEATEVIEYIALNIKETPGSEKKHCITKEELQKEAQIIRREVAEIKIDSIKWMFIFWVAQIATTAGIVLIMMNFYCRK